MELSQQQLNDIWNGLVEYYGDKLPDMDHHPIQFKYYLKMYMHFRYMK